MANSKKKPELRLLPGDPSEKELLALYESLTGRKATAKEIAELRKGMAEDAKE